MNVSPLVFQRAVLNWFDQCGRKNLPWQQEKNPYRVFISEIMLQQTQVSTVIPYFQRFMERFPDVQTLANANEDAVLHVWTGLGYYNRARNLHRTAKIVLQDFQGKFPTELITLQSLPGIGRSTAGAILSIALQKKAAILDGNVRRVLTRLYAITTWPSEKKTSEQLWHIAEKLTPQKRVADYTQAMMDIGATVCIRGKPHCAICPFKKVCLAHKLGIEKNVPHPKPKKILPVRQTTFLILRNQQHTLLEKRAAMGVWNGLWSFPETTGFSTLHDVQTICQQRFRLAVQAITLGESFRHTFSHFHLDILPAFVTIKSRPSKIMDNEQQIWYNLHHSQAIGLPAPVKKLLKNL
ncbi:MAG: hypothetical protein ACD_45C00679G0005 [uncultured bacterium]|nr:MAG: hypothetical protein ACD_45C00679G0005 [uncultured bacterium]